MPTPYIINIHINNNYSLFNALYYIKQLILYW